MLYYLLVGDYMAFDGLFIHNLINEMKDDVIDKRINRFYTINETDFLITLLIPSSDFNSSENKEYNVLFKKSRATDCDQPA